jgi:single-strand DNA-binding protein
LRVFICHYSVLIVLPSPRSGEYLPSRVAIFFGGFFLNFIGENSMSYLNQAMLIGNLGHDPEVLKNTEKSCFVRLSLATNKKYKDAKGEVVKITQWHTVYVSSGLGRFCASYLKKGAKVFVQGELRTNEWTDKNGQTRHTTAVYADTCRILVQKPQNEDEAVAEAEIVDSAEEQEDDLPF